MMNTLHYSLERLGESTSPNWVEQNPATGQISGTPSTEAVGEWKFNLTVEDGFGGIAHTILLMNVRYALWDYFLLLV